MTAPSRLVFLSQLSELGTGTKVRFLGCVENYDAATATLTLQHRYPAASSKLIAIVNVEHVLEATSPAELDAGSWINVVGYVRGGLPGGAQSVLREDKARDRKRRPRERAVCVQAVLLWSAGIIKVDAYESALVTRQAADDQRHGSG